MNEVKPARNHYLRSLAAELESQASRVRDLIGAKHWLSDGYHKEELLRVVLRRHSPSGISWTRGFVLSPTDADSCSREQDILAVDTGEEAPIFAQGELAIAFPRGILAAISVKTTLSRKTLDDAVAGLNTVRDVAHATGLEARRIWCGAYFYGAESDLKVATIYEWLTEAIRKSPVTLPLLQQAASVPLGPDLVSLANDELFRLDYGLDESRRFRVRGFDCGGLATSIFLVNVLDHIAGLRGRPEPDISLFAEGCGARCLEPAQTFALP